MNQIRFAGTAVVLLALTFTGCQQPDMDMEKMMQLPPRAAELKQLDAFVGNWEGISKAEVKGMEEFVTTSGAEVLHWEADGRILVSTFDYSMADAPDHYKGISVMLWDPAAKKVRSWSFTGHGDVGEGSMTYDDATRTWTGKDKGYNLASRGRTCGEGSITFQDDDTQTWKWTMYARWLFFKFKVMEFEGKSVRK